MEIFITLLFGSLLFIILPTVIVHEILKKARSKSGSFKGKIEDVYVGRYLFGLHKVSKPELGVKCVVTDTDFVFCVPRLFSGPKELDRLSRNSVYDLEVKKESGVSAQTIKNVAFLGNMGAALSGDSINLIFSWLDPQGKEQKTIFEDSSFKGTERLNKAANSLRRYISGQSSTRTCPYCAETIKAQAKLCRFCGKELNT